MGINALWPYYSNLHLVTQKSSQNLRDNVYHYLNCENIGVANEKQSIITKTEKELQNLEKSMIFVREMSK